MSIAHADLIALNEYLDGALTPPARSALKAHLAGCSECAARLDELRALFATIESLPDLPLGHDLTPGVLAALGRESATLRAPAWLRLGVAAQAVLAALLLVLAWPLAAQVLPSTNALSLSRVAATAVEGAFTTWSQSAQEFGAATSGWLMQTRAWLRPPLALEGQWLPAGVGLGAVSVLWLLGNGLLLRVRPHPLIRRST